jgi:DNA-binding transcriptional MerR regulator
MFVSVDDASQAAPPEPSQSVADIASSVPVVEPHFDASVKPDADFEEIYRAAEIPEPAHGYTITKIAEMLQSERIRSLPLEVKKSSVLLALDAAGVKIEQVVEDAVRRDRALDAFERVQQRAVDELEARKDKENQEIQADLDRLVQEHNARVQANKDAVAKEKERFYSWRLRKQKEEQKIADCVSPFVAENPITTGSTAAPSKPSP